MSQQIINIGSAPNDGTGDVMRTSFDKCNLNFTELYAGVVAAGPIGNAIEYTFNNTITEPPAAGEIRFNQATQASTTILWASHTTMAGINIKQFLSAATTGAKLILQDKNDNSNYIKFDVIAAPVDKTTYWEFSVSVTASGGTLPNARILAAVTAAAGAGGAPTGAPYITSATDATLTAERVLTDTATVTWDFSTAGQARANAVVSGGGNVSNSGTPANGQWAQWTDATHIQGVATASMPFLQLTGGTLTGNLTISHSATTSVILNQTGTTSADVNDIVSQKGGLNRWLMRTCAPSTETGSNVGSDFLIYRYTDAGAIVGTPPFQITRSTGVATFGQIPISVTPAAASNDTSVATTAFVKNAIAATPPLLGYLSGLSLIYATVNSISVAAGICTSDDGTTSMTLASQITKATTSTWAVGNSVGGLDTGSIAANTWYHIFVIMRTDTSVVDALISTSASAPAMPANYTKKRRVGSFKTDAGLAIIQFIQNDDYFAFNTPILLYNAFNLGSTAGPLAVGTPPGVKVEAHLLILSNSTTTGAFLTIAHGDVPVPSAGTPTANFALYTNAPTHFSIQEIRIRTNTSAQIGVAPNSVDNFYCLLKGWYDSRGK